MTTQLLKAGMEIEVALLPVPNVIVLPKTSVSFYLQDERYIEMIRDVSRRHAYLVLSMTDHLQNEEGEAVSNALIPRSTGVLTLPQMMEEEPHGLHHGGVVLKGLMKVRLTKILETKPILMCKAEILEDDMTFYDLYQNPEYNLLCRHLESWIDQHVERLSVRNELKQSFQSPEQVMNHISLLLIDCRETRQALLETLPLYDRFEMLCLLLLKNQKGPQHLKTIKAFFEAKIPLTSNFH
jgi:ATP-dependent Lon protease